MAAAITTEINSLVAIGQVWRLEGHCRWNHWNHCEPNRSTAPRAWSIAEQVDVWLASHNMEMPFHSEANTYHHKISVLCLTECDCQDGSQYPAKRTNASRKVSLDELHTLWQVEVSLPDFAILIWWLSDVEFSEIILISVYLIYLKEGETLRNQYQLQCPEMIHVLMDPQALMVLEEPLTVQKSW